MVTCDGVGSGTGLPLAGVEVRMPRAAPKCGRCCWMAGFSARESERGFLRWNKGHFSLRASGLPLDAQHPPKSGYLAPEASCWSFGLGEPGGTELAWEFCLQLHAQTLLPLRPSLGCRLPAADLRPLLGARVSARTGSAPCT